MYLCHPLPQVPEGWSIPTHTESASDDAVVKTVVACYPWQTHILVFLSPASSQNGKGFGTTHYLTGQEHTPALDDLDISGTTYVSCPFPTHLPTTLLLFCSFALLCRSLILYVNVIARITFACTDRKGPRGCRCSVVFASLAKVSVARKVVNRRVPIV